MSKVAVIGGGPAGLMAAAAAARNGHSVLILEKNEKIGKKLYITGKGRCNVTNNCDAETFLQSVCVNRKFLFHTGYGFTSHDTMDFFARQGLKLKTERGGRVFPESDHASDVTAAMSRVLRELQVQIRLGQTVRELMLAPLREAEENTELKEAEDTDCRPESADVSRKNEGKARHPGKKARPKAVQCVNGVILASGERVFADAVIIATGGLSYPSTGSTGDGYRLAMQAGHTITTCYPSLVPLEVKENDAPKMQGLSLKNVTVTVRDGKKVLFHEMGEMMFTHFGVTGPLILTASTVLQDRLTGEHPLVLEIDLKPALDRQQLEARILREIEAAPNRHAGNVFGTLFPARLVPVMLDRCGIPSGIPVRQLSREQRQELLEKTKCLSYTITGTRGYSEAIITRGGVSVKEIDPSTMESRLVRGLYFAGEVLDVDAVTGGFNLQIAWSTGHQAGMSIGKELSL